MWLQGQASSATTTLSTDGRTDHPHTPSQPPPSDTTHILSIDTPLFFFFFLFFLCPLPYSSLLSYPIFYHDSDINNPITMPYTLFITPAQTPIHTLLTHPNHPPSPPVQSSNLTLSHHLTPYSHTLSPPTLTPYTPITHPITPHPHITHTLPPRAPPVQSSSTNKNRT